FAIAIAYVEAALVVHLRHLYYPDNPLAIFPLHLLSRHDLAMELAREVATVVMIVTVALLVVRDSGRRFAAFVFLFGIWDLFYYVWLEVLIDWPQGWLEWDVLYLIPWIWLGPWIAPALIALVFTLWGGHVLLSPQKPRFTRLTGTVFVAGAIAGVAAFLWPAVPLLPGGEQAFDGYQPGYFPWWLYLFGLLGITVGLVSMVRNPQH
ncbi:MAG: hypothetical protein PVJ39_20710, partial [Gammaproteobacteria bacterium]